MRTLGLMGAIGLMVGLGMSAHAAEPSASEFFADSQLSTVQAMTDTQLASVEGMSYMRHHGYGPITQSNTLYQLNLNDSCGCGYGFGFVSQNNGADQMNRASGKHSSVYQTNWADQANISFGGGFVQQGNSAYQSNRVR